MDQHRGTGADGSDGCTTTWCCEGRLEDHTVSQIPVHPGCAYRFSALSEIVGNPLPYDDTLGMRQRMWDVSPTLVRYDVLEPPSQEVLKTGLTQLSNITATASTTAMKKPIADFYRTDPISRASVTMAACSKAFTQKDYQISDGDDGNQASQVGSVHLPSPSSLLSSNPLAPCNPPLPLWAGAIQSCTRREPC